MPHDHREPEMIPRQRQSPPTRLPDRDREWAMKLRPEIVAEPLPGRQDNARIGPNRRIGGRYAETSEHIRAVVEPQIGRDRRAARAAPGLPVKSVFGRDAHQHMHEADAVRHRYLGTVRSVGLQCVGDTFEVAPPDRRAVEAQQPGNSAHARRSLMPAPRRTPPDA
jgi:hypothetical protein